MSWLEVLALSFIEGLTEFLPVSSTGHLILTSWFFGIQEEGFVKAFNIIIQFGAILSVLALYWRRFLPNKDFYLKVFLAFLPAAVIGLLVKDSIDSLLGSVDVVAWALLLGGFVLIWSDRKFNDFESGKTIQELRPAQLLTLGLIQCLAFIPGVSRSASTILGGLWLGLSRKEAAEFSFFLAVPTLAGASFIKSLKVADSIQSDQVPILIAGCAFSFLFALIAIRFFIKLVSRFGFKHFGYYRIVLGLLILFLLQVETY